MWVFVSVKLNKKDIFGDLLGTSFNRQQGLEVIETLLQEKLKEGKCLIVLDDVWMKNENGGIDVDELLKDLLSMSGEGSKILMTMRSTEPIHQKTGCQYKIYQLQCLHENDCWSIFENIAFGRGG
ncbi:hypothetical protein MKX03_037239, partial [Papaver bracteatum]